MTEMNANNPFARLLTIPVKIYDWNRILSPQNG